MFKEFLSDPEAWEMFIEGIAGTGKTTDLKDEVQYCIDNNIVYAVCAFTHQACNILRSKLPTGSYITTLDAFLKLRPGVNESAKKHNHISISTQSGEPEPVEVLFIDEFSMVGQKRYLAIGQVQDPELTGTPQMKVVYLGDPIQLPPVGDIQAVKPTGPYYRKLTHVYRQAGDSKLKDTIKEIVAMARKEKPISPLLANEDFIRNIDIVKQFKQDKSKSKILLAYTNNTVEDLNEKVQKHFPEEKRRWSPTIREYLVPLKELSEPQEISMPFGEDLSLGTKYKVLEHLISISRKYKIKFILMDDQRVYAVIFGHGKYNQTVKDLRVRAAMSNSVINHDKPKEWAKDNASSKLAKDRKKAWRDFLTINDCVICLDYVWATTIHKSQGSTYENVYMDMQDLHLCAERDLSMYLRLAYVGISRASNKVYAN